VQARVEVNKRQILALFGHEGFCRATHARHPIQLFVGASNEQEAQMNVRYRVELSQTERAALTALLSAGKHAARRLKRAQILLAADAGASDDDNSMNSRLRWRSLTRAWTLPVSRSMPANRLSVPLRLYS
jgi:hypothetical protein